MQNPALDRALKTLHYINETILEEKIIEFMGVLKSKFKEFFEIDLRSLALFRIGLAFVIIGDLLVRLHDLRAHYSDEGILPRSFIIEEVHPWNISLNMISGLWQVQLVLFLLTGLFAFGLLIGYKTRLMTFLTWLFIISLQIRNPVIIQGGDLVLKVLLFWSMFLPLGAYWSLDQFLSKKGSLNTKIISVGTVGLLLQICFIYWFTALLKIDPSWISEGTAIWYSLSIEQYATNLGRYLLQFPQLLKFATYSTILLEAFGPFLAFSPFWTGPLRFATVIIFTIFHLILNFTMELALFPYICIVAWIVFLPPWFWEKFIKKKSVSTWTWKASFFSNFLASLFLIYILLWNVATLSWTKKIDYPFPWLGNLLSIDQEWNMFSPSPLRIDGWYVIPALLEDGSIVDLFNEGKSVSWEKPYLLSATYKNDRWRSYLMNLIIEDYGVYYIKYYASYLCINWNKSHSADKQVVRFDIYYMLKTNIYGNPNSTFRKTHLWHQECHNFLNPRLYPNLEQNEHQETLQISI